MLKNNLLLITQPLIYCLVEGVYIVVVALSRVSHRINFQNVRGMAIKFTITHLRLIQGTMIKRDITQTIIWQHEDN